MRRKLPALPAHWKRDYFFYANGYVKDMDWWDASPFTVAQLPFHGMSAYPYPASEKFPDDADALEYQLNWNDRFDSGEPVRSYRFDYRCCRRRRRTIPLRNAAVLCAAQRDAAMIKFSAGRL